VIQKLERALQNSQSKLSIEEIEFFLLSLHACFMGNEHVPRTWFTSSNNWDEYVKRLLISDLDTIVEQTHKYVEGQQLSLHQIAILTGEARQMAIQMIEEELNSICGSGFVFYEQSRFSPLSNGDFLDLINHQKGIIPDKLFQILSLRLKQKAKLTQQYGSHFKTQNYPSVWQLELQKKIEKQWQLVWSTPDLYLHDAETVQSLAIKEEL
jgi:hypothetical protein